MRFQTSQKAELFARALSAVGLGVFAVFVCATFALGITLVRPQMTTAATSSTINFQARLETNTGAIAPDGNYNVTFHLFSSSTAVGGTSTDTGCSTDTSCEWVEQYTYNSGAGSTDARVRVVNGYLTVNLGSVNAFSGINWNQQQWLTMDIGGTVGSGTITWDGQMAPRLLMTATPYAFQAGGLSVTNGSYTDSVVMTTPTSASHTITVPDETGTVCTTAGSAACTSVYAPASGGGNYVQLQGSTPGTAQTGNFNISGTGIAGTLQSNILNINTTANDQAVITSTLSAPFVRPLEMLDSNLTTGQNLVYHMGHDLSNYDTGYFGFNYQGANSTSNFVTLGLYGNDNIFNIQGSGNVGVGTTAPKSRLDVSGGLAVGSYAGVNAAPSNGLIVSGSVGIGTNSPGSAVLAVQGSSNDMVTINTSFNNGGAGNSFIRPLEVLDSSLVATQNLVYHIGRDLSNYDTGYFGFNYQGLNSTSNFVTLGLYGNDNILNIQGTGNVGLGTTAPKSRLDVSGGLAVGSYAGVNAAPSNGLIVSGYVGIGTNNPTYPLKVSTDATNTGANDSVVMINGNLTSTTNAQWGLSSLPNVIPTGASSQTYYGGQFAPVSNSANVASAKFIGVQGTTYYYGTGTVGIAEGGYFKNQLAAAGTVTTAYGIYIDNPDKAAGGTITTNYGLYVANQTNGSTNYAAVFQGGNVGIGTTTPSTQLQVASNGQSVLVGDNTNTSVNIGLNGTRGMVGYDGANAVLQAGSGNGIELNVNNNTFGGGSVVTIASTGATKFQNNTNSTAALQVQNLAGANLLTVDTSNTAIVLGNDGTPSALTVRGGAATGSNVQGSNLTFDASNGTGSAGSGDLIFRTAAAGSSGVNTVTVDHTTEYDSNNSPVASQTVSFTVNSQSNSILVIGANINSGSHSVSSIVDNTNSTSFTKITDGFKTSVYGSMWYLKNPPAGTNSITITLSTADDYVMGITQLYNVDQTTPIGTAVSATGTSASPSVTVTSNSTQLVIDNVGNPGGGNFTGLGGSQTQQYNKTIGTASAGSTAAGGSSSTTMTWTISSSQNWIQIGVPVNPSANATAADTLTDRLHVAASGNVGIGTSSPQNTLDVSGNVTGGCTTNGCFVARFINTNTGTNTNGIVIQLGVANASRTSSNYFISFAGGTSTPSIAGKIQGTASGVVYTTTGADYGEYFSILDQSDPPQAGDIVSISLHAKQTVNKANNDDDTLVGVVSDKTGFLGNDVICNEEETRQCEQDYKKTHVIVGLVGQVPTNVSNINGEIENGDTIVSSSLPGFGARQVTTGKNVGSAVESTESLSTDLFNNINCPITLRALKDPTGKPVKCGQILVYVNPGWHVSESDAAQLHDLVSNLSGLTTETHSLAVQLNSLHGQIPYLAQPNTFTGTATNQMVIQDAMGNPLFTADTQHMVVSIVNLTVTSSLTINGHIITGGNTPNVTAFCDASTATIQGNDDAGIIVLIPDKDCTNPKLISILFDKPYTSAPRISITPANANSATLPVYVDANTVSTTGFDLDISPQTSLKPAAYQWYYQVIQ